MESRPPQESPRRNSGGRKPNGSGGSPTPPWLWLLLIAGFALIFWQFAPKNEVAVRYSPWFLEQVKSGNIKSLTVQGTEAHGELRKEVKYRAPSSTVDQAVKKFYVYFPSEQAVQPIIDELTKASAANPNVEPIQIDPLPPNSANSLVWITLLLPT